MQATAQIDKGSQEEEHLTEAVESHEHESTELPAGEPTAVTGESTGTKDNAPETLLDPEVEAWARREYRHHISVNDIQLRGQRDTGTQISSIHKDLVTADQIKSCMMWNSGFQHIRREPNGEKWLRSQYGT